MTWLVFRGRPPYPAGHLSYCELLPGEDVLEAVQRRMANDPGVHHFVGVTDSLPPRKYHGAWRTTARPVQSQGKNEARGIPAIEVTIDLALARELYLFELRDRRDQLLREADGQRFRLLDLGQDLGPLIRYTQALRDLPARVEQEIAHLSLDGLERHRVKFPEKPWSVKRCAVPRKLEDFLP